MNECVLSALANYNHGSLENPSPKPDFLQFQQTAMGLAAEKGHAQVVEALLAAGPGIRIDELFTVGMQQS